MHRVGDTALRQAALRDALSPAWPAIEATARERRERLALGLSCARHDRAAGVILADMATHAGPSVAPHVDVLIVGAGLSGIGAACHLQREAPGVTYALVEARGASGGTWDLFRFPGVRSGPGGAAEGRGQATAARLRPRHPLHPVL